MALLVGMMFRGRVCVAHAEGEVSRVSVSLWSTI